jgi:hypothetical protein
MNERPLDLSSLADVHAPEVVHQALRRFRRRFFGTGAVVLLAALALVGGFLWATVINQTTEDKVEESPGVRPGTVYEVEGNVVLLEKVAETDDGLGLKFVLATPDAEGNDHYTLNHPEIREFNGTGGPTIKTLWIVVAPPSQPRFEMELTLQQGCNPDQSGFCRNHPETIGSFTVDLEQLDVPQLNSD